jgi:hypothetical protein
MKKRGKWGEQDADGRIILKWNSKVKLQNP